MKLWRDIKDTEDLLNTITKVVSENKTINYGCRKFCDEHPNYTIEQARSKYYQLVNSNGKIEDETIVKPWDAESEEYLINYYNEQSKYGKSKSKIFGEVADKLDRSFNSVSGRYYLITKRNDTKNKPKPKTVKKNIDDISQLITKVDIDVLFEIVTNLKYLKDNISDKDIEIILLKQKISELEHELATLQEQIPETNSIAD